MIARHVAAIALEQLRRLVVVAFDAADVLLDRVDQALEGMEER